MPKGIYKHKPLTEEHKKKIGDAIKGEKHYLWGKKRSPETLQKMKESHLGQVAWNKGMKLPQFGDDKASAWKGDKVGYHALHEWVYRKKGRPKECEFCGKYFESPYRIHWANKSGKYKRKLDDWIRLCVSCHMIFDKKRRAIARLKNKKL